MSISIIIIIMRMLSPIWCVVDNAFIYDLSTIYTNNDSFLIIRLNRVAEAASASELRRWSIQHADLERGGMVLPQ